jgi:ribonuclease P protein component
MERLRHRADFLATARGAKAPLPGLVLQAQARDQAGDRDGPPRIGFTVSRKVGNAVERNRVRRRLREVVRLHAPLNTQSLDHSGVRPGHDYVLIGRRAALDLPFERLVEHFHSALRRIHAGARKAGRPADPKSSPTRDGESS